MATKILKTLVIHLMRGESVSIADTVTDNTATRALNEFKNYGTMHYTATVDSTTVTAAIPYHAVQYIEVSESYSDVTQADPYGCETESVEQLHKL